MFLGIDPGLSGALAFLYASSPDRVSVYDMPVVGGEVDGAALAVLIRKYAPAVAVLEQVASRPGQGVSSMFKFGASYGVVKGVLAALEVPRHDATPGTLRKHFRIPGGDAGKEAARALAVKTFPFSANHFARKKDHGRADAAIFALYGLEVIGHRYGVAA